jgi:hypothetical protein
VPVAVVGDGDARHILHGEVGTAFGRRTGVVHVGDVGESGLIPPFADYSVI